MKGLKNLLGDFINVIYPKICPACGNVLVSQEENLCMKCLCQMPRIHFHDDTMNTIAQMFWGRVKIEYATSMFYYNKGGHYQQLLHHLKYKGKKEIGFELGKIFGNTLKSTNLSSIDIIVPVPLHTSKKIKRGYNQSEWIAKGLAHAMDKPLSTDIVERIKATESQTKKSKYQRWKNVENIFRLGKIDKLKGKHILLVDDIVTTGATLEACASELLKIENAKVSIVTLALVN